LSRKLETVENYSN